MIEYARGARPVVGRGRDQDEAEAGADLLHQADAVLELEAEGREVLDEGRAVHQLDGGADALGPRHRLDDEVEIVLSQPGRRPARLRPPPPRRVEAEHREQRPLQRRLEGLRDRVHAEGEAVDPVAHRHVLRLRLEAHVGGALAGAEGQEVVEDAVGVALLPVDRGRLASALGVGEPVDTLRAQRRVHVLPAHEAPGDQDLAELPPRVPLLDERLEQLRRRDLLHPDEDVAQAVLALAEGLQLLDERRGSVPPELLLVLGAGVAEAVEAERAQLRRVLGVVRAPHGAQRVELPQAVPAGDEVGRGHDARLDDNSFGIKAVADH